jgi:hypothetical protein
MVAGNKVENAFEKSYKANNWTGLSNYKDLNK